MNQNIKVLIVGSRVWKSYDILKDVAIKNIARLQVVLGASLSKFEIVSGGAPGADTFAEMFAKEYGIKFTPINADWDDLKSVPCVIKIKADGTKYNALAGFNRNTKLVEYTKSSERAVCLAFSSGQSRGTADTIMKCVKNGIDVIKTVEKKPVMKKGK